MKFSLSGLLLGTALALIFVIVTVRIMFREQFGFGLFFVVIISAFIGLIVCIPLATAISEKFMNKLFAVDKGKVPKDYSKARWLVTQERFEEAIAEFEKALEEEPENIALRLEIAEIYSRDLKDHRRAISELEGCSSLQPEPGQAASILNRIADIYETNLGDTGRALAALSRIAENWPGTKFAERAHQRIQSIRRGMQNRT